MSVATGAGAGGAAAAAVANAIRASGAIVRVEPADVSTILERTEEPLVVFAEGGKLFSPNHQYLTGYKGLVFYTKSREPIHLPSRAETVQAQKIWIPG